MQEKREKEFNLLESPWVKVVTPSLEQKEVSLTEAIVHAHEYGNLSGEMATQDAAVLRVLLAVVLTVFYRYDGDGNEEELSEANDSTAEDVFERWEDYWVRGKFPEQAVREYLGAYSERFWLFHPRTPFWQVSDLQYGTDYDVKCLLGNAKESMNKATRPHFSMTSGEGITRLGYGEAARWLIHLNAYAINVKSDKNAPGTNAPVGTGRLGRLGLVLVNGQNLFQILMLNLCALRNDGSLWEKPKPIWEQEQRGDQGHETGMPDNLPERYTIQSRRIRLMRDADGYITKFRAMGGDFFPMEKDYGEPMTLWKEQGIDKKTGEEEPLLPQKHNPAVHVWREFPALLCKEGDKGKRRTPGVVQWIQLLRDYNREMMKSIPSITFRMVGMEYGDGMSYTYGDCVDDALTMSAELLDDLGREWVKLITEQIRKCHVVSAEAIAHFSKKMELLYGSVPSKNSLKDVLVGRYFFSIDSAFREWLMGIEPRQKEREEKLSEWESISYRQARKTVEDYVADLGPNLYIHREAETGKGKKQLLSVPKIMNDYLGELSRIYRKADGDIGEGRTENEQKRGNP